MTAGLDSIMGMGCAVLTLRQAALPSGWVDIQIPLAYNSEISADPERK